MEILLLFVIVIGCYCGYLLLLLVACQLQGSDATIESKREHQQTTIETTRKQQPTTLFDCCHNSSYNSHNPEITLTIITVTTITITITKIQL